MNLSVLGDKYEKEKKEVEEFEKLTFPLMNHLYSTALRMTKGDQFDAEDLVQTTHMKAYNYFHKFEKGTTYSAWLFRILTNNFINEYRSKQREPERVDFETTCSMFIANDVSKPGKEPTWGLTEEYDDLFDDEVTDALDNLPFEYRIVLLLCDVNDLKYKEIAEVIRCPIGTVMSRLNRGRKMLAEALKDYATAHGY